MKLRLPENLRAQIVAQARAAHPGECCGLLLGRNGDTAEVLALYPARNLQARNDRFEIAPEDHFAALKRARAEKMDVIGCYHSHPDGAAQPSATDLAGAGEEGFFWVIVAGDDMAACIYRDRIFRAIDLIFPTAHNG